MNLFQMAMQEVAERKQWYVGEKVTLAKANGQEAYLHNDDCFIRLYVTGQRDSFTVAWLDLAIGEWLVAREATEENYEAWVARIKAKPDEDKLLKLARKAERKYPQLRLRPFKAAELVRRGHVQINGSPNRFEVTSQSNPRGHYLVDIEARTCTCPDYGNGAPVVNGAAMCKHRLAALMLVKLRETSTAIAAATAVKVSPNQPHSITAAHKAQVQAVQAGVPVMLAP